MISAVVFTTLRSLVNDRCYPNTFRQSADGNYQWPQIRYTVIDAVTDVDLCGSGNLDTDDTRVQLDVVGKSYADMILLRDQVVAAMNGVTDPPVTREGYFETFDEETKTHRAVIDYVFQPSSATGSP